ncbi:Putative serine protease HhoA [bacterium HR19]|nr:Putative serine protease HhoA [bacterium HR19]
MEKKRTEKLNRFINVLKAKFVFSILLFSAFSCGGGSKQKSEQEIIQDIQKVVTEVRTKIWLEDGTWSSQKYQVLGSGVILSRDGKIVTNAHVVNKWLVALSYISDYQSSQQSITGGGESFCQNSINACLNSSSCLQVSIIWGFCSIDNDCNKRFQDKCVRSNSCYGQLQQCYSTCWDLPCVANTIKDFLPDLKSSVEVRLKDDILYKTADIVEEDITGCLDLAVIKISSQLDTSAEISQVYNVGDSVFVVGNPYGLSSSVSRGIISGVRTASEGGSCPNYEIIQTDAAVGPGNSGGGMFRAKDGKLIGIITWKVQDNIGFAISVKNLNIFQSFKSISGKAPFLNQAPLIQNFQGRITIDILSRFLLKHLEELKVKNNEN